MKPLVTSAKYRKRPLEISVDKDTLTIGQQGFPSHTLKWEDVWEMVLGNAREVAPTTFEGWGQIAKGAYFVKLGAKRVDRDNEGCAVDLVDEAILNLNAAMWRG